MVQRPQAHRTAVPLQVEVRREPQPRRGLREKLGLDHVFTLLWPFFQRTVAVITLKCGQNPYIIPGDYKFVCLLAFLSFVTAVPIWSQK